MMAFGSSIRLYAARSSASDIFPQRMKKPSASTILGILPSTPIEPKRYIAIHLHANAIGADT